MSRALGIDAVMTKYKLMRSWRHRGLVAHDLVNGDSPGERRGAVDGDVVAGYPHITVPAGFIRGLPLGISFFAARGARRR